MNKRKLQFLFLSVSIILTVVFILYAVKPKPLETVKSAEQLSTNQATEVKMSGAQPAWVNSFNDPVLTKFVQDAIKNHVSRQGSVERIKQAYALLTQVGGRLNPYIDLNADFEAHGAWGSEVWTRFASESGKGSDYEKNLLAALTVKVYLAVIESNVRMAVVRNKMTIHSKILATIQAKHDKGEASGQALSDARADLTSARERFQVVEGLVQNIVHALEILLGHYPSGRLKLKASLPAIPTPSLATASVSLNQRANELNESVMRANEAYSVATSAFPKGQSDLLDVLRAQENVLIAKSNVVSIQRLLLMQYIDSNLIL